MVIRTHDSIVMKYTYHRSEHTDLARNTSHEGWTAGGLVGFLGLVAVFLALLTAPAFVLGVVLGAAGLKALEKYTVLRRPATPAPA